MPVNILMPALSPTMEKGNLAKWLKKEGDKVKAGDVIAEIETDKATMEVEAVDEGTLGKIVVAAGTADVPVNEVIAVLLEEGEDKSAIGDVKAPPKVTAQPAAKPEEKPAPKPAPAAQQPAPAATPAPRPAAAAPEGGKGPGGVFASPLARRLARQNGIDLSRIQGSGPHGRIIARDVEGAPKGAAAARAPSAPGAAPSQGFVLPGAMPDDKIKALFEDGSYDFIPHDSMRRTIATRLTAARIQIPQFYVTMDCEIDELLKAREEINASAPKGTDGKARYKLSVNDFVIKAFALALIKIPAANVTWLESGMIRHKHADIGVAVALDGGLITPIVRHAEEKTLGVISNEMRDLGLRARNRKLKPTEYEGGSSAVSNLGMYGVKNFTAIINPPHSTILAVGAGEQRVVVKNGKPAVATIMSATLSCDHRSIDGALGAELLRAFKEYVEKPLSLLA
ncbi:MAG TPA: pyruvate dehydrogenase complex dihydrolipoamide acetyltransferase [Xanthobacteraceae bacterium]|nr:pyruvate dehydrogenase complex dihydrolipoamide acetyltransferase [Xanthobacteraceae bacterium]